MSIHPTETWFNGCRVWLEHQDAQHADMVGKRLSLLLEPSVSPTVKKKEVQPPGAVDLSWLIVIVYHLIADYLKTDCGGALTPETTMDSLNLRVWQREELLCRLATKLCVNHRILIDVQRPEYRPVLSARTVGRFAELTLRALWAQHPKLIPEDNKDKP